MCVCVYIIYTVYLNGFVCLPLKPCIRELFLVCVGGCLSWRTHPVYNTHTLPQREAAVFSSERFSSQRQRPKTSRPNILKMLIFPSTHQAPATIILCASSKYSRAVVCFTFWFHSPLNIHIEFSIVVEKEG